MSTQIDPLEIFQAAGQAIAFRASYQALPVPHEPTTNGVEHPPPPPRLEQKEASSLDAKPTNRTRKRRRLPLRWRGLCQPASSGNVLSPVEDEHKRQDEVQAKGESSGGSAARRAGKCIFFLGDSVIAGVGCESGETTFPQHVATALAQALGEPVVWEAFSEDGADVFTIRTTVAPKMTKRELTPEEEALLTGAAAHPDTETCADAGTHAGAAPALAPAEAEAEAEPQAECKDNEPSREPLAPDPAPADFSQSLLLWSYGEEGADPQSGLADTPTESCGPPPKVDAIVVMCGVNDWKLAALGRTPATFREEIEELARWIGEQFGEQCKVVFPSLPIQLATAFPEPMRSYVVQLSLSFDEQKKQLAESSQRPAANRAEVADDAPPAPPANPPETPAAPEGSVLPSIMFLEADIDAFRAVAQGRVLMAADGLHPNATGYEIWATQIGVQLGELLRTRDASVDASPEQPPAPAEAGA